MNKFWHRFTSLFTDVELAGTALVVAIVGIVAVVALPAYLIANGRYVSAASLIFSFGGVSLICIRDYRRGKWSVLSAALVVVWVAFTIIMAIGVWWVNS
jgi:hypothetical protein